MNSRIYHKGHRGHEVKSILRDLCALCALCGCSGFLPTASLNAMPNLVGLNGTPIEAALVSVDSTSKLSFQSSDRTVSLPFNELVRWGNPVRPKPQIMVVLADGGRLLVAAAWAGGVPLRLDGDSLVVLTDIWDEVRLPRSTGARNCVRPTKSSSRSRAHGGRSSRRGFGAARINGSRCRAADERDRVVGELTALSGGSLELSDGGRCCEVAAVAR